MKVLFIGGTGIISTACTQLAIEQGIDITLLKSRPRSVEVPSEVKTPTANNEDTAELSRALAGARRRLGDEIVRYRLLVDAGGADKNELARAAAEEGNVPFYIRRPESDPIDDRIETIANPYWEYAHEKIACEERLMHAYREEGFPVTIVRPSLTYGDTQITLAINSWAKFYTVVDRMRRGKKVIVPGDGSSLWVITHNFDFASRSRWPSGGPLRFDAAP